MLNYLLTQYGQSVKISQKSNERKQVEIMCISGPDTDKYYSIEYIFKFSDERPDLAFTVLLQKHNMTALPPKESREQEWTLLDYHKCSICPWNQNEVKNCPIAFNISGLIEKFGTYSSIESVHTEIHVEERTYMKNDSIQEGLRSILGIYMASSDCPHMNILKPMVRFHLPFASIEETIYRHVTNYLLSQYFEYLDGKKFDINLTRLSKMNENVDIVNRGIISRIERLVKGDANKNALLILNTMGRLLKLEIEENLNLLKYLYCHSPSQ